MKNILFIFSVITFSSFGQNLVSATLLNSYTASQAESVVSSGGWSTTNMDFHAVNSYSITYNTVDGHGDPTIASGAVYIPVLSDCEYAPITIYEHGTEFVESQVPSTGYYTSQGVYFSTTGYIAVLPDYIGLGSSPGIHLYHHWETEATASLDLVRAVRELLDTSSTMVKDNYELFITGYSHGGHSAMATNKYIQDNQLEEEFNVVASAPMSGAYALNGAQYDLIFDGDSSYYASPFLPYILASLQEVYGNLYSDYSDVYDSPYDTNVETYLQNGNYSIYQWYFMLGGPNYYQFMQDSVIQNMEADVNRDSHPINVALKNNNLYDWVPLNPVRMLYCGADSMVAPENSTFTLDTMLNLGATDVQAINLNNNLEHSGCFVPATTYALEWFESLSHKCTYMSDQSLDNSQKINIYPNPAKDVLYINVIDVSGLQVQVFNLAGQEVDVEVNQHQVNLKGVKAGSYFIFIKDSNGEIIHKSQFIKL